MRTSCILQAVTVSGLALNSVSGLAINPDCLKNEAMTRSSVSSDVRSKPCQSLQIQSEEILGRRRVMKGITSVFGGLALATIASGQANALDMDSFVNSELESDKKNCDPKRDPKCIPKLTPDEALCKYGQSGEKRGEACKRVKAAGGQVPDTKSQGKSLGGAYAM